MKRQTIQYFFTGLMICFTVAVLILSAVTAIATDAGVISVSLIWQAFVLSILCSMINLVYRSEKLKFVWQSIIGYILTTATIMACGFTFGWYSYGGNHFNRTGFVLISFLIYSLFYLVTWMIIWRVTTAREKELNYKLDQYKQKQ